MAAPALCLIILCFCPILPPRQEPVAHHIPGNVVRIVPSGTNGTSLRSGTNGTSLYERSHAFTTSDTQLTQKLHKD